MLDADMPDRFRRLRERLTGPHWNQESVDAIFNTEWYLWKRAEEDGETPHFTGGIGMMLALEESRRPAKRSWWQRMLGA